MSTQFIDRFAFLGLNKIAFRTAEIALLIENAGVEIIESPGHNSFCFTVETVPFICVPRNLSGLKLHFHLLHELAHILFDNGETPNEVFLHGLVESPEEDRCDNFALVGLMPDETLLTYDFLEEFPTVFGKELYERRIKLFF